MSLGENGFCLKISDFSMEGNEEERRGFVCRRKRVKMKMAITTPDGGRKRLLQKAIIIGRG
jgi:hypothetical protein